MALYLFNGVCIRKHKTKKMKKLVLTNKEWDLLIKKLSSIVSKANILIEKPLSPRVRVAKTEQILDKALECLEVVKYKDIKNENT